MSCQEEEIEKKLKTEIREEGKPEALPATTKQEPKPLVIKQEPCTPESKTERETPSNASKVEMEEEAQDESKEHNAWGSRRSSSWTSCGGDWDADGWAGSDYGRGQWGYWYGSMSGYNNSWNAWEENYANGQDWSWNKWNQNSWPDAERNAYRRQSSWGETITRPGTCDLFDAPTPKKASPATSTKKIAKGSQAGTPKASDDDVNKDASEAAKELQKKHHAKYMRFYRSLDSLQLNLEHATWDVRGVIHCCRLLELTSTSTSGPKSPEEIAQLGENIKARTRSDPSFQFFPLLDVSCSKI